MEHPYIDIQAEYFSSLFWRVKNCEGRKYWRFKPAADAMPLVKNMKVTEELGKLCVPVVCSSLTGMYVVHRNSRSSTNDDC